MVSLDICRSCVSAEVLQASQGSLHQKFAHRARTADTEGPVDMASHGQRGEDQKIDQIVLELMIFGVPVGVLQEMKWFGDVYEVMGSVALTAGQPMPEYGEERRLLWY